MSVNLGRLKPAVGEVGEAGLGEAVANAGWGHGGGWRGTWEVGWLTYWVCRGWNGSPWMQEFQGKCWADPTWKA